MAWEGDLGVEVLEEFVEKQERHGTVMREYESREMNRRRERAIDINRKGCRRRRKRLGEEGKAAERERWKARAAVEAPKQRERARLRRVLRRAMEERDETSAEN